MRTRTLGDLEVSALGFGAMSLGGSYGEVDVDEATATVRRAVELGITLFDTADIYGDGRGEELLAAALEGLRADVVIVTKLGLQRQADGVIKVNGDPAYVRVACEASLRRLGDDHIDLYLLHRPDSTIPIEDTIGAMAELVADGKVRRIGLCEASAATLRRAAATHPITALESEWSLWTRELEKEVVPTARELGIGLIGYSPLGRGMLTGAVQAAPTDSRRNYPRFTADHLEHNREVVEQMTALAASRGTTPGRLALAWLLAQGDDVVPIPGTKRRKYLEDNVAAADVTIDAAGMAELEQLASQVEGDRIADMSSVGVDTPPQQ